MSLDLSGSYPALVTALRSPGELDLAATAVVAERAVADGANGVLVAGSTGEGTLLAPADRRALTAAVSDVGTTVLACASGATLDDVHADVARLAGAGADAVLVLAPSYLPLSTEELVDAHLAVAERADVATLVYHIPQFTGAELTAEGVRALSEHRGIVAIKDSSPDAPRRAAFVAAAAGRLAVMVGHAPTMAAALQAGAAGSITAVANLRQDRVVKLHAAVAAGDQAEVDRLQESLTGCELALRSVPGSMSAAVKAAMQLEGLITERWCMPPLRSVAPGHLDLVRTALLR